MRDLTLMEAFAAEHLIVRRKSICVVAREIADCFPNLPALSICFTLASVASNLEVSLGVNGAPGFPSPPDIYRVIAVLSADIFSLELTHGHQITASFLAGHWDDIRDPKFRATA